MPIGPGKYDDELTIVREKLNATACALIVIEGNKGSGFSLQVTDERFAQMLPSSLRFMADEIENSLKK